MFGKCFCSLKQWKHLRVCIPNETRGLFVEQRVPLQLKDMSNTAGYVCLMESHSDTSQARLGQGSSAKSNKTGKVSL